MAGFEVIIYGRFWVIAEGGRRHSRASECEPRLPARVIPVHIDMMRIGTAIPIKSDRVKPRVPMILRL
jgi:hypothetical protein